MNSIDIFIQNYFSTVRTPLITELMYILSRLFDVTDLMSAVRFIIVVLCIAVLIYLIISVKYSVLFVLTLIFGAVGAYLLKIFFDVTRPLDGVIIVSGQSFPSYHATIAVVFFTMLMYIFDRRFKSTTRVAFNSICIIGILLVATSRVYLGVHWLSDVVGGIVLGAFISYLSILIFNRFYNKT